MKKISLLSFVIIFTFIVSGIASAETSSSAKSKIDGVKQKIEEIKQKAEIEREQTKQKIASSTEKLKEKKEELKNEIEIKIGKKLDDQKIKIANEFEKTIRNLKDLVLRIESRIAKIDAEKIDTSVSKTLLANAKTNLSLAETELTNLENLLAQNIPVVSTSTSEKAQRNTILKTIKTQSEKTKNSIKTAHLSIIKVVESLKKGLIKKNSTSTQETN